MTLLLFLQAKIGKRIYLMALLIVSNSLSCFEKNLKLYLYAQMFLSEDDTVNNLVTLNDC